MKQLFSRLETLFKEFERLDSELSGEDSEIVEFEDRYFSLKLKLQNKLDVFNVSHSITVEAQNSSAVQSVQSILNFRLPKLDILVFSGKFEDWMNFKDLFVSTVNSQTSLSNSQKFQYLKGLLSDEPDSLIKHIPLSDDSYEETWGKLMDRQLLDSGFESSFVNENVINILGLKRKNDILSLSGISVVPAETTRDPVVLKIAPRFNEELITVNADKLNKVTSQIPIVNIEIKELDYLKGIPLSDEDFSRPSECVTILGSDCFFTILRNEKNIGSEGQPIAQSTMYGWVVASQIQKDSNSSCTQSHLIRVKYNSNIDSMCVRWHLQFGSEAFQGQLESAVNGAFYMPASIAKA
ncbi:DUF1758 domain-containing protein [Nephila pilipes]|uniref:DUF1758 domain-containing protein n=1 Tax=Nephila pilipes TaxID=299642 RepID=A0A8X6TX35_NEPPI|nr:DUF1758 domain-containing protein [Nephila pilipes]